MYLLHSCSTRLIPRFRDVSLLSFDFKRDSPNYSQKIRPFAPLPLQKFLHYYGFCWLPTWLALLPLHFVPSQLLSRRISQGKFSIFQSNWHILLPLFYVQLLGFAIQCSLTHNVSLRICFSPFSHFFAACFLQILNYSRHPCIKLTIPVGRLVGDSHSLDIKHAWRTYIAS